MESSPIRLAGQLWHSVVFSFFQIGAGGEKIKKNETKHFFGHLQKFTYQRAVIFCPTLNITQIVRKIQRGGGIAQFSQQ